MNVHMYKSLSFISGLKTFKGVNSQLSHIEAAVVAKYGLKNILEAAQLDALVPHEWLPSVRAKCIQDLKPQPHLVDVYNSLPVELLKLLQLPQTSLTMKFLGPPTGKF